MSRLVLALPLLLAPAGEEPGPEPAPSPEAAVLRFDKAVRDPKATPAGLDKLRKASASKLRKRALDLDKRGKKQAAQAMSDCAALLESLAPDAPLGKAKPGDLLKQASVKGKYTKLLHVLHVPGDLASYTRFNDYGTYSGTSYAGRSGLKPGFWVYVHPRWFVWESQP